MNNIYIEVEIVVDITNILKIAFCEDSYSDAVNLKLFIENTGIPYSLSAFDNGSELLETFSVGKYDVIFMDIFTDGTGNADGIETIAEIRKLDTNVMVAFTTTSLSHALESYRLGAVKYIEKPIAMESIKEVLELALYKKKNRPMIKITLEGGENQNIPIDSIMYIEQDNRRAFVHLPDNIISTARSINIADFEEQLSFPPFLRCYQSFIVNFNYVHTIDKKFDAFIMKNGEKVYIRRGNFTKYKNILNEWRIQNLGSDI